MKPSFNFSSAQRDAIYSRGENLLVAAGAGSGKTTVLVERILHYVSSGGAIESVLALTFTNAAAADMKEKLDRALSALIQQQPDNQHLQRQLRLLPQAQISTIHSFCLDLLRKNYYRLQLDTGLKVAGEAEIALLEAETLQSCIEEAYDDPESMIRDLADAYGGNRDDNGLLEIVLGLHHFCRSRPHPWAWLKEACQRFGLDKLEQYPFAAETEKQIRKGLAEAMVMLRQAEGSCPIGCGKWQQIFADERAVMAKVLRADSLSVLIDNLRLLNFGRLSAAKDIDEELKEKLKALHSNAKKVVTDLQQRYGARSAAEQAEELVGLAPLMQALSRLVISYDQKLSEEKRQRNWLDFADMEHFALALLEDEQVSRELRLTYAEILIDEYQDINEVQEAILQRLSSNNNLFAVGDVKQSIYRFRLAEPQLFLSKYNDYGERFGGRRIDLNCNYRSETAIIAAVNYIFRQLMRADVAEIDYDSEAELRTEKTAPSPAPEFYLIDMEQKNQDDSAEQPTALEAETRLIATRILELKKQGYSYSDMAILLRATHAKAPLMVRELQKAGIPAVCEEGEGFLAATEISLMLAVLKIIDNPRQDIALTAVLRSPLCSFSVDDLMTIRLTAAGDDFYSALLAASQAEDEMGQKCRDFCQRLNGWRQLAAEKSVSQLISHLYRENGYFQLVGAMPDGAIRQLNLRLLLNTAYEYEQQNYAGLFRFIRFLSESSERHLRSYSANINHGAKDAVRIISIHRSKGLEFPVVFVAGLASQFNFMDERKDIIWERDSGLGPMIADRHSRKKHASIAHRAVAARLRALSLAEEMRIYYVAMTRAEERLIITAATSGWEKKLAAAADAAANSDMQLPPAYILQAQTPLAWLSAALIRHPDAAALRGVAGIDESNILADEGSWQIKLIPMAEIAQMQQESHMTALPLPQDGPISAELEQILCHSYPYRAIAEYPAKWTVSELSRAGIKETATAKVGKSRKGKKNSLPKDFDPALRGTAYHLFLEKLDLAKVADQQTIAAQLEQLIANNELSREQAEMINIASIAQFFGTSLGQRLAASPKVIREFEFTYFADSDIGEPIMVQGMLDAAFWEEDGWVLLDYKTGGYGKTDEQLLDIYGGQLKYYAEALARLLGSKSKESALVMLDLGSFVESS